MTANRKTGVKPETSAFEARAEAWMQGLTEEDYVDVQAQETSGGVEFFLRHEEKGDLIRGVYGVSILELAAKIDENIDNWDPFEINVKYPQGSAYLRWNTQLKNFISVWKWLRKYLICPF